MKQLHISSGEYRAIYRKVIIRTYLIRHPSEAKSNENNLIHIRTYTRVTCSVFLIWCAKINKELNIMEQRWYIISFNKNTTKYDYATWTHGD